MNTCQKFKDKKEDVVNGEGEKEATTAVIR